MPRVATAVFVFGAGLHLFAGALLGSAPAFARVETARFETTGNPAETLAEMSFGARSFESNRGAGGTVRIASHEPVDDAPEPAAGNTDANSIVKPAEKSKKAPARQIPIEEIEPPDEENDSAAASGKDDAPSDDAAGKSDDETTKDTGQMLPAKEKEKSRPDAEKEAVSVVLPTKKPAIFPGLPVRKPPKPPKRSVKRKRASGKSAKKPPSSRTERDKKLCRALQACRNGFVKCKSKIKYPDQSEPWIIAKEVCGSHYKACVEKDFRGGEWVFTRWFYFQELKCE